MASTSTAAPTVGPQGDGLGRDIVALAVVVILGTIMTVLDLTIVNVAIPAIGAAFRAPVDTAALASAFGITFWAAVALTAGAFIPALLLPRPPRANQAARQQPVREQAEIR